MATKLTKNVQREITVTDANGVEGPVILTITPTGIEFRGKGKQRKLTLDYSKLHFTLPQGAPAKFSANPVGWLVEGGDAPAKSTQGAPSPLPAPAPDATT